MKVWPLLFLGHMSNTTLRSSLLNSAFQGRWQRFARSRGHRFLALLAALWVSHAAYAQSFPPAAQPPLETARQGKAKPKRPTPAKGSGVVGILNINKASASQWQIFPSVGPAIASKILERRQHKSFRSIQELREVRGIGKKFMERFAKHLRVQGPTTLQKQGSTKKKPKRPRKAKSRAVL